MTRSGADVSMKVGVVMVAGAVCLSACGGDAPISVVPGTGSSSNPASGPTPTPTPTSNVTLDNLVATQAFTGFDSALFYSRKSDGTFSVLNKYLLGTTLSPIYNAEDRSFAFSFVNSLLTDNPVTVSSGPSIRGFKPADKVSAPFTLGIDRYRFDLGRSSFRLLLLSNSISNPLIAARFTGFGVVEGEGPGAMLPTVYDVRPFSYGLASDPAKLPVSGTATFTGFIIGRAVGDGGINAYNVDGTIRITVNYATREFQGQAELVGTEMKTGEKVDLGNVKMNQISIRNSLDYLYTLVGSRGDPFNAQFAGPAGEEIFGGFTTNSKDPLKNSIPLEINVSFVLKR